MKILEVNKCELNCKCGWNITIGGEDYEELEKLLALLEEVKDN